MFPNDDLAVRFILTDDDATEQLAVTDAWLYACPFAVGDAQCPHACDNFISKTPLPEEMRPSVLLCLVHLRWSIELRMSFGGAEGRISDLVRSEMVRTRWWSSFAAPTSHGGFDSSS